MMTESDQSVDRSVRLIVGLGNIGDRYVGTRHNIGFAVVDEVASRLRATSVSGSELYESSAAVVEARKIVLAWPATYMNRSGIAVAALLKALVLRPSNLLVVVDDFHLPLGRLRFRQGGSDGGQNGLRSISELIGTQDFARLRVGLSEPPPEVDPAEYVLSPFAPEEVAEAQKTVARAAEAVIFAIHHPLESAMAQFNSNPDESD